MEDDCTPRKSDDEFPNAPEFEVQMNWLYVLYHLNTIFHSTISLAQKT